MARDCVFFARGACTKGTGCTFRHATGTPVSKRRYSNVQGTAEAANEGTDNGLLINGSINSSSHRGSSPHARGMSSRGGTPLRRSSLNNNYNDGNNRNNGSRRSSPLHASHKIQPHQETWWRRFPLFGQLEDEREMLTVNDAVESDDGGDAQEKLETTIRDALLCAERFALHRGAYDAWLTLCASSRLGDAVALPTIMHDLLIEIGAFPENGDVEKPLESDAHFGDDKVGKSRSRSEEGDDSDSENNDNSSTCSVDTGTLLDSVNNLSLTTDSTDYLVGEIPKQKDTGDPKHFMVDASVLFESSFTWVTDTDGTSAKVGVLDVGREALQIGGLDMPSIMAAIYFKCLEDGVDELGIFFEHSNLSDAAARSIIRALRIFEEHAGISVALLRLFANPQLRDGAAGELAMLMASRCRPPHEVHLSHCGISYKGLIKLYESVKIAVVAGRYPCPVLGRRPGCIDFEPLWMRVEWNAVPSHLLRRARSEILEGVRLCPGHVELGPSEKCRPTLCKNSVDAVSIHLIDFESLGMGFHTLQQHVGDASSILQSSTDVSTTAITELHGNPAEARNLSSTNTKIASTSSTAASANRVSSLQVDKANRVVYAFLDTNAIINLLLNDSNFFKRFWVHATKLKMECPIRLVVPSLVRIELDNHIHQPACGRNIRFLLKDFLKGQGDPGSDVGRMVRSNFLLFLSAESERLASQVGAPQSNDELIVAVARQWRFELRHRSNNPRNESDEVVFITDDNFCREQARSDGCIPAAGVKDFLCTLANYQEGKIEDLGGVVRCLAERNAYKSGGRTIADVPPRPLDLASFARDVRAMVDQLRAGGIDKERATVLVNSYDKDWSAAVEALLALA